MQRAGLDALHHLLAQAVDVGVGVAALLQAEALLGPAQAPRAFLVAVEEHRQAQAQVDQQLAVQRGDLGQAVVREGAAARGLLVLHGAEHVLDDVAGLLQVDGQLDDLGPAPAVALAQVLAGHARQVQLDRRVERVDVVVELADLLAQQRVAAAGHLQQVDQHLLDDVAHAQRLAHRVDQRQARRVQRRRVEVARAHAVLGGGAVGHDARAEGGHLGGQRQAGEAAHRVVEHVEGDHQLLGAERPAVHPLRQRADQRQHQHAAGDLEQQAAQGHPAAGGVLRGGTDQGEDTGAQVGAHHQAQRDLQRDHLGGGEGRGEQHGG